jgi:hypothetical protein
LFHTYAAVVYFLLLDESGQAVIAASRPMPPASAFQHLVSQSGTRDSGTGLGFLIPVPGRFQHLHSFSFRYWNDQMPNSLALRHKKLY